MTRRKCWDGNKTEKTGFRRLRDVDSLKTKESEKRETDLRDLEIPEPTMTVPVTMLVLWFWMP